MSVTCLTDLMAVLTAPSDFCYNNLSRWPEAMDTVSMDPAECAGLIVDLVDRHTRCSRWTRRARAAA